MEEKSEIADQGSGSAEVENSRGEGQKAIRKEAEGWQRNMGERQKLEMEKIKTKNKKPEK